MYVFFFQIFHFILFFIKFIGVTLIHKISFRVFVVTSKWDPGIKVGEEDKQKLWQNKLVPEKWVEL